MVSTLTKNSRPAPPGADRSVGIDPGRRRQRSLPLALVALGCMALSIAAFVGLQLASSDHVAVLAIARPVAAGTEITDGDLVVANVSTDAALTPIGLAERESVLGRTAAVDLVPGTLLVESALGQARALESGEAIVGIDVTATAAPTQTMTVGDRIQLVETAPSGSPGSASSGRVVLAEGRVTDIAAGSAAGSASVQVAVAVPAAAAPSIAAASVEGRIAVVVLP